MTGFWIVLLIYFIGVIISLVLIAWHNAKNRGLNQLPAGLCFISWFIIISFLFECLCDLISKFIKYPYEWFYNIFRKKYGKEK